ncbi:MAG TPA: UDP-3-O-(3-hydroxymyristoyl)glucosamine N-acyltransferase [Kiritimatiellia bacterium]|nr:UDP-3-O-(3-hydroxymyristoyl)glucosamine N-acyltransferase [Kiritimatiellia bacterium]
MATVLLSEIARRVSGELVGSGDVEIRGVSGIRTAEAGDLSFAGSEKYLEDARRTGASALLVGRDWTAELAIPVVKVDHPGQAFASIAASLSPSPSTYAPGIHPTAFVHPEATVGDGVHIGPGCVVQAGAVIGARTSLVALVYAGEGVVIGEDCLMHSHVALREHVRIGDRVTVHNGSVIGSDGFGFDADSAGVRTKQPQLGIVEVGNDVEIGACVTIDRARYGKTRIGNGVKIDNLVQIAHNVWIKDHAVIVSQVGISGSTIIGKGTILAGQAGVAGHLVVGDGVVATGRSGITKDIPSGQVVYDFPAISKREFAAKLVAMQQVPKLKQRIVELEKAVARLLPEA